MGYDADKTDSILDCLQEALRGGKLKAAMQLLRHADAGGRLKTGPGMLASLKAAVGEPQAAALVKGFAGDPCPYCRGGRERCEECGGKGHDQGTRVCTPCAGLGLRRCSFCNGTSFAGYDFVPRGLRPTVMALRLKFASKQIKDLTAPGGGLEGSATRTAKRILAIDLCRGILANAVEQARLNELGSGSRPLYTPAQRVRIERACRQENGKAEAAIRKLLQSLAEQFAGKAQRLGVDPGQLALFTHRAKVFAQLSRGEGFGDSVLRTPMALRRRSIGKR